ncbi:uracil DNA glycosylase superfamily [Bacteroidales bacterium 6E]|nr:uracil DNA glycosylase superfamily [Bacteroidales bacterium 6E]
MPISEKIIGFNRQLEFTNPLPDGIRIMNPYAENPHALEISSRFYRKFYGDDQPRRMIMGINPGRFGAGVTGIPFTDTRRLKEKLGMEIPGLSTYEPSSVFVYEFIEAFGGVEAFYGRYYISAVCPLGFVKVNEKGRDVNYNYYDSRELTDACSDFIVESLETQLRFGMDTDICFCLGNNQNYKFLHKLNEKKGYFGRIVPLEHPRYIMQYKIKQKEEFVKKFVELLL